MSTKKPARRATIYLDPDVHQALRRKAAAGDQSISDVVSAALKLALAEDVEDLAAFGKRRGEKSVDFAAVVKAVKRGRDP